MDFKSVLKILIKEFNKRKINYALIGGFAFGLRGVGNTTVDLDFFVDRKNLSEIDSIMIAAGYECKYSSENVSQYINPLEIFGEVDYIHAFRESSLEMLARSESLDIFDHFLNINILQTEDLIALKLQAIRNNPKRKVRDLDDIRALISVESKKGLDWSLIEKYAVLLEMTHIIPEIKK